MEGIAFQQPDFGYKTVQEILKSFDSHEKKQVTGGIFPASKRKNGGSSNLQPAASER